MRICRLAPRRAKKSQPWTPRMLASQMATAGGWPFFGECSLTLKYNACHMMLDFIYSIVMYCLVFHFKHG